MKNRAGSEAIRQRCAVSVERLKSRIQGQLFEDEETLREVRSDFGRIVHKMPRAVVVPASTRDVQTVVEFACREGWTVSTRGSAHTQGGQSLNQGGILLDMSALNRVEKIEEEAIWVQAGAQWGDLVQATSQRGLVPPVLTNNLGATVGGTLSMAGLGVGSHRYGVQIDNVEELEVVTGEGHLVRCSPMENGELFDCTRCGLGQFSVITRARLRLRPSVGQVRTYFLLYDDLTTLTKDQAQLVTEKRFDFFEASCAPCAQGFRQFGESRVPFAEWFYPMHLSVEHNGEAPQDEGQLEGLRFYRKLRVEDSTFLEFAKRFEPAFALWKQTGSWELAHPGMEAILPWNGAASYIQGVLKSFPHSLLGNGYVLFYPCRLRTSNAPLFKHPEGEFTVGFEILPAVPRAWLPMVLALLSKASDLCMQMGAKRVLSGWVGFDHSRWKAHFGETWSQMVQWKRFYDPKGILNPGFVKYDEE